MTGIRGVVFRVNALSVGCSQSISSLLRVPTVAAIGLTCISSAIIRPSLIARALPSLLIGLVPWLPCGLLLLLLVLDVLLLAVEISFLFSCAAANIDQQWGVRVGVAWSKHQHLIVDVLVALGGRDLVVGDDLVNIFYHGIHRILVELGNPSRRNSCWM